MDYVLEKIAAAKLVESPFRHLYLGDLLTREDFEAVTRSPMVDFARCESDEDLCRRLEQFGWHVKQHPGCIQDLQEYLRWHSGTSKKNRNQATCEGYGVAFRWQPVSSGRLGEIAAFFSSDAFLRALAEKFGIDFATTSKEAGLHKYLDGYEISPHPDWRRKALTVMVNVNPSSKSEELDFHTHYLRFKPQWRFIQDYWRDHPDADRCWVPWDWCDTVYQQTANNSMVAFAPGSNTLHAVKARYDHLATQRTQFYANLNLPPNTVVTRKPSWQDFHDHAILGMALR